MGEAHTEIAATRYGTTYGKASTILRDVPHDRADQSSFVPSWFTTRIPVSELADRGPAMPSRSTK